MTITCGISHFSSMTYLIKTMKLLATSFLKHNKTWLYTDMQRKVGKETLLYQRHLQNPTAIARLYQKPHPTPTSHGIMRADSQNVGGQGPKRLTTALITTANPVLVEITTTF